MAKPELGVKRACPETGRKFYDLNKEPIVSPYTGISYPLSFFEGTPAAAVKTPAPSEASTEKDDNQSEESELLVPLEEADDVSSGGAKAVAESEDDIDVDDDIDLGDEENDPFLANSDDDDDDDDDVIDIIGVGPKNDDE